MLRFCLAVLAACSLAASSLAADGGLDPSFNAVGSVNLVQYANLNQSQTYLSATAKRVLVRPDNRILVIGHGTTPMNVTPVRSLITIVALSADGSLDTSFFGTGRRNIEIVDGVAVPVVVNDAEFQNDGSVIILCQRIATDTAYLIRLFNTGVADTNFGSGGQRRVDNVSARALIVGAGNEIYVLGGRLSSTMNGLIVTYTDLGAPRTGWGFGGSYEFGLDNEMTVSNDWFNDGFMRPDGLLYLVGEAQVSKAQTRAFRVQVTTAGTAQEGSLDAYDFGACNAQGVSSTRLLRTLRHGQGSIDLVDFEQDLSGCSPSNTARYLTLESVQGDTAGSLGFLVPTANERVNDLAIAPAGDYVYLVSQVFPIGLNDAYARVVRYRTQAVGAQLVPDPSFGVNGYADFFADASATQSAGGAIGGQIDGRMVVAGGISTDVLGNAANHNTLVFRVDQAGLFRNSFE